MNYLLPRRSTCGSGQKPRCSTCLLSKACQLGLVLLVLGAAASGVVAQAPSTETKQRIANVVARDLGLGGGLEAIAGRLSGFPASLSLPPGTDLQVTAVRPAAAAGTRWVRLECAVRKDCLPFQVMLHALEVDATSLRGPLRRDPGLAAGVNQLSRPLTHSGDRVSLIEERPGMRLKVAAVCLQSGALGDSIRVRNLATHQVLLATITARDEVHVQ